MFLWRSQTLMLRKRTSGILLKLNRGLLWDRRPVSQFSLVKDNPEMIYILFTLGQATKSQTGS